MWKLSVVSRTPLDAEDSVIVDTGNMSFEEVVNRILSLAKEVM